VPQNVGGCLIDYVPLEIYFAGYLDQERAENSQISGFSLVEEMEVLIRGLRLGGQTDIR
jgi:hypothetical protein